jgi:hypothetical protein
VYINNDNVQKHNQLMILMRSDFCHSVENQNKTLGLELFLFYTNTYVIFLIRSIHYFVISELRSPPFMQVNIKGKIIN